MKYSKIQKIIASIIIPFFLFGMVFHFPINIFNFSNAGETKLYSLVSILVNKDIYNDVYDSLETYGEDISKQLKNTKVVIIPTPKNASSFQIASLNEKLYYEGYKGIKKDTNFKSKLVGTILVGKFPLPTVYKQKQYSTTILPYVDFEDKSYIYNHKTKKFELNKNNIAGIKADIWHGVINPNTGDRELDIKKINDFFKKDHDFYEGKGNFKKDNTIINGKINEKLNKTYKPYVFYFDQFREQKAIKYPSYVGYEAYLKNKEALTYNRYSKELAKKLQKEVLDYPTDSINDLLKQIPGVPSEALKKKSPDLTKSSDIMTKAVIDKTTKNFIEVLNSSKIGDFRKNVNNAGRYTSNNKVNVDLIPYLISALDEIGNQSIKSTDKVLENKIDNLVMTGGLSRYIALPTKIEETPEKANVGKFDYSCKKDYTNILYGKVASEITKAEECSIYRGNNKKGGKLVKANRGLNIYNIKDDSNLCKKGKTSGYWGGNSPLNLKNFEQTNGDFILKANNYHLAINPLFDIAGAKKNSNDSKLHSPLNCFENNYIFSKRYENPFKAGLCPKFVLPIEGETAVNFGCDTQNIIFPFSKSFTDNYIDSLSEDCTPREMFLDGDYVIKGKRPQNLAKDCIGSDRYYNYNYYYKRIPSYIKHISPTPDELKTQIKAKISPNLPLDIERYIDFIGASGNHDKIKYPELFSIKEDLSDRDSFATQLEKTKNHLDKLLEEKSAEINRVIARNNPSSLVPPYSTIYNKYLKIAEYPTEPVDLKKFLKDLGETNINILGEQKTLSYYDNIVFSLFWSNLKTVGQKYKFVFENYLSDQTASEFKHFLPKNKKIYEIAYLGAPGDAHNMYIGINPEEKGKNPYSELDTKNSLLDTDLFSFSTNGNSSGNDSWIDSNIGTTNFTTGEENVSDALFKCAPPEGVSIFEWPSAIMCWLKNLSFKVEFNNSKCSSETLFADKEDEDKEQNLTSDIIDNNSNGEDSNGGGNENNGNGGNKGQEKNKTCRNDLNKNGVEDCLEKDLEKAKLELISSSKKAYINSFVKLETKILDSKNKKLEINNVKTKFELIRIIDKKNNKIVKKEDYNKYTSFKELTTYTRKGKASHSFYSKNKIADYYFRASIILENKKTKKEIVNIKSNTIKIEIRDELFSSNILKISDKNTFQNGDNDILASDKNNIYLVDLTKTSFEKQIENIRQNSNSKEKIIIGLNHFAGGNKIISLNYPLKLSLTRNGKKVIEDINILEDNLKNYLPVYALDKKGEYKLTITNKYGETTSKIFSILPEKASKADIYLSTNVVEKSGEITSNIFILKDKYGNISDGYNYKVLLESEGEFSFPLNNGENLSQKELNVFNGYKGFRIKPGNKNGIGKIKIDVLYKNKIIASSTKNIQTIEKINIDIKKPEEIKVGGNKTRFELEFKDKQGNLLKNLNSRIYLSINKNYGFTKFPYFPIKNGKAIIDFKTKTLAGEDIPIELKMEGMREIMKDKITIVPDKAIKLDFNLSKEIAKASVDEQIKLTVQLKDRYNNKIFNDNSTKLKLELKDEYKDYLTLNSQAIQTVEKGEAIFNFNATSNPGMAYFKVSTIPDLSNNYFTVKYRNQDKKIVDKKIYGVGEKAAKIKTYYFWDKNSFKNKKYNSLYTVMLGADYANIAEENYLASSILFDKNNRNLAVTGLVNNPYKFSDLVSIDNFGKIRDISSPNDLTQDLDFNVSINNNNKLFINIYNKLLNKQIGNLNYIFSDNIDLGICETTIGECSINQEKNSIFLKNINKNYNISKKSDSLTIQKDGNNLLKIDSSGNFISNNLLKFEIDNNSKEDFLIINIKYLGEVISKLIINISNEDIIFDLSDSNYSIHNKIIDGKLIKNIYYNNIFITKNQRTNFSKNRLDDIENFRKKGGIGWGGDNKFLLDFAAGKNVGEAVISKQSFSTINLGDPVISLKPIQTKFKDGTKKSFNATIGKKLSNDDNIKDYQVFDYDNDGLDDILLIKNDGYLKLLENKQNAKNFVDKGDLAFIPDKGNLKFIKTGDFSGDGFDDIFVVNNKNKPFLLNNNQKDFKRIALEKQFNLKGNIIQVESFDMDNDGKTDIVTLDDSGEINIFYGGGTYNNPKFTKKLVGNGSGLKLNSTPINKGALVYFDGLYQIPDEPNTSTGIINQELLNKQIFVKVPVGANKKTGTNINKTFIKSEYSESAGIKIEKVFKDINGKTLQAGDIVEVKVTIKNTSNSIKRHISFLDNIQKPFIISDEEIDYKKLGFSDPIAGYDFYIKDFALAPGARKTISYKLKTPAISYGHIKVGLFEKGEIGDDPYGDIIVSKDDKNCGENSKIYKSIAKRSYSKLLDKEVSCDLNKLKLPKEIEDAKKINIDKNKNGIPDYIDELKDNPDKAEEYANKELDKLNKEDTKDLDENNLNGLDKINEWTEDKLKKLDNLIEGFNCGFGGAGCISTPLNWAPLAPGNDPTLFGKPIGDGLKVNEGIPIFSSLTYGDPYRWPPSRGGAGGYYGVNYPLNTFRLFVSPTLTGGVGTAICYGGPASVAGYSNPPGISPIVPGGNCIVTAKPLKQCSPDGSDGDPSMLGNPDYFGGDGSGAGGGNGNGNNFGVINGNCGLNQQKPNNVLNKNFVSKYLNGLGNPTTFTTPGFQEDYKNAIKGLNANGGENNSLYSFNGEGVGEQIFNLSLHSSINNSSFEDVIKIKKKRVSAFPSFLMDWTTRQIEEIATKLADFPTLFIIMPDFSGISDTNWGEFFKKSTSEYVKGQEKEEENNQEINSKIQQLVSQKNSLNCETTDKIKCYSIESKIKILEGQKKINSGNGINSGIKAAYEFLSNVPLVEIEPQQINIDIPYPDTNTIDKFLVDAKSTLKQWKNEITRKKYNKNISSNIDSLIANLEQNIETIEYYKQFPRKLTKLLNQKEVRINQVLCSVDMISEITNGWISRNGKRFKAWVETYILIKAVLKSWQLLIDVFNDYDAECHECKNERQDLLDFEFKLIDFILPKFPVIQFPKWPDLILDVHNIRASINIKIPDVVINQRPLVLPNIPQLTLPEINADVDIKVPEMPLIPRYEFPELPDIPTLPEIKLPDLPPPPKLPKIFTELEGVLKILKLITKAMCLLKQLPFVPEWRAGDQIAFLTERNGYMPSDFIDLELPQFSVTYLDAIKVTTYVNLEQDTSFLVDTLKAAIAPFNKKVNNWANKFSNAGLDSLDFSNKSININKKINLDKKDKKTGFSKDISDKILNLYSYISKNKDEKVKSSEFRYLINKSLASSEFTKDPRTDKIRKLWKEVNNYNFSKENKLISKLKQNNREKFENLNKILENELRKNYKLKKDLKNLKNKKLFVKVAAKNKNTDFVEYKKSVKKYNDEFKKSAIALLNSKADYQVSEIRKQGQNLLARVKGGINNFSKNAKKRSQLLVATTVKTKISATQNSCQMANNSPYHYNYKGLYILEKNKSYRLFNYLDELNGKETYSSIDFDKDGDQDLLYIVNGELYLKENLSTQKNKDLTVESPIILKIKDNKYFNGDDFVEAVNGFKEINSDNGYLNLSFQSPTDKSINHFTVEYYTIIDKFLNEGNTDYIPKNINKNIIDAFVEDKYIDYKNYLIKKHKAYINYIGDIKAVRLDSYEIKDLSESLAKNNKINISATTPIYTANNSAKIQYYFTNNKNKILNIEIPKNSSIRFKEKIIIIGTNGKIYAKTNKKIHLVGNEIKKYIGLPLFEKSEFSVIPDLNTGNSPATIEIKYDSGYTRNINFKTTSSYYYYNLGNISNYYLIRKPVINDYYYGKIYAIKDGIRGTYSAQKLFSPQIYSDKIAPELDGLSKIRIPVYQDYKLNLKNYIYENSGLNGVKNINIKLAQNSNIIPDNYKINHTLNNFSIEFEKFNKIFKEKIEIILEDKNGNKSSTPIDFEVYSPIPKIEKNKGNRIFGQIDEKLLGEPINIYRIRSGVIKRLETTDNKIKTYTVDEGKFTFDAKGENKNGLYIKYNNQIIAEINENTGKIELKNINFEIKVNSRKDGYPEINIINKYGEKIYYQFIKLNNNIEIKKVDDFNSVTEKGLFIKLYNSNYQIYNIPNGAKYSAGVAVIYRISDNHKKEIFTIFPDGRIKYNKIKYFIEYENSGNNIILNLKSKIGNKIIAKLLFNINGTYLMK